MKKTIAVYVASAVIVLLLLAFLFPPEKYLSIGAAYGVYLLFMGFIVSNMIDSIRLLRASPHPMGGQSILPRIFVLGAFFLAGVCTLSGVYIISQPSLSGDLMFSMAVCATGLLTIFLGRPSIKKTFNPLSVVEPKIGAEMMVEMLGNKGE